MIVVRLVETPRGPREECAERCPTHGIYRWFRVPGSERVGECYPCRHERDQARRSRRDQIRKPQRPRYEGVPDTCSLCGQTPLPARRRSWCSDSCVLLWQAATSGDAAHHLLAPDLGLVCWECGERPRDLRLEVDHRRPLWSLDDQERQDLRWWLPFNLQLLCRCCHAAKTRHEAGARARGTWTPWEPVDQTQLQLGDRDPLT